MATSFQWKCPWAEANASNSRDSRLFDASFFSTKKHTEITTTEQIEPETLDMEIERRTKNSSQIYVDCGTKFTYVSPSFVQILDGLLDLCMCFAFMSTPSLSFRNKFSMRDFYPKWTFSLSSVWIPHFFAAVHFLSSHMHWILLFQGRKVLFGFYFDVKLASVT